MNDGFLFLKLPWKEPNTTRLLLLHLDSCLVRQAIHFVSQRGKAGINLHFAIWLLNRKS